MENYGWVSVAVNNQLNFRGNGAAIVIVESLDDADFLQGIASDMNQPATCFLREREKGKYDIRWFAPDAEIGLCGHGALAAAGFLNCTGKLKNGTFYYGKSGVIEFKADADFASVDLEGIPVLEEAQITPELTEGTGIDLKGYYKTGNKHILLVNSEEEVRNMKPDFCRLRDSDEFGFIVTARGTNGADVVSRTLVPHVQQLEDHATGSSHAALVPFWGERLGETELVCRQLSPRGGEFKASLQADTVTLKVNYKLGVKGRFLF